MRKTRVVAGRSPNRLPAVTPAAVGAPFPDVNPANPDKADAGRASTPDAEGGTAGAPVASLTTRDAASPAAVYLARLGPGSQRAMRCALESVARACRGGDRPNIYRFDWAALSYSETAAVRAALLARRLAPATVNRVLTALRGVLREAFRLELMPTERYLHAREVRNVRVATLPRGRAIGEEEIEVLLAACARDRSPAGARDAAAVAVLFGCGLRRQEAIALDLEHLDLATGTVKVIAGKGRRDRITFLGDELRAVVRWWVRTRGPAPGPLLLPILRGGHIVFRRLTGDAVRRLLARRAWAAGVKAFTPHDCRRTCATSLLAAGADVLVVQRMLGHSDPATTQRYDKRPDEEKQRAAGLLRVRFVCPAQV